MDNWQPDEETVERVAERLREQFGAPRLIAKFHARAALRELHAMGWREPEK